MNGEKGAFSIDPYLEVLLLGILLPRVVAATIL
jgi:hypothetical protein